MSRPPLPPRVDAVALSDVGLVRKRNEDAVWMADRFMRSGELGTTYSAAEIANGLVLAVADGVGGANAGDEASEFVVGAMGAAIAAVPHSRDFATLARGIQKVAGEVNTKLERAGRHRPGRGGMSTTYTAVVYRTDGVCWVNAGDSRLYRYSEGILKQVTRDHTLREMTGDDRIPGNIIVNCFGTEEGFYCDVGALDDEDVELYLLCSDGLSDYVAHQDMESIISHSTGTTVLDALRRSARQLVSAAKEGGGGDNITLLMCRPETE